MKRVTVLLGALLGYWNYTYPYNRRRRGMLYRIACLTEATRKGYDFWWEFKAFPIRTGWNLDQVTEMLYELNLHIDLGATEEEYDQAVALADYCGM